MFLTSGKLRIFECLVRALASSADGERQPRRVRSSIRMGGSELYRAISTGQLHVLPRFHTRPIDVVVFHGSQGKPGFEVGFPLRCFQRLSLPYLATQRCNWRHNWYTIGTSTPVLSY